ncbi:MAG: efflux RND transporter periplasmic adaptor subunit [Bacteroidetes bacterium]|nr:efflux RND transporter periplasmic adaptor subunit [Bacteroidota bacterium]
MKTSLIISLALTLILFGGCRQKAEKAEQKFVLSPTMEKSATFDFVKSGIVQDQLKLTGKVTYNEDKVVKIYPQVSGVVKEVRVGIGDHVEKGQVLAVINSTEMAVAENDLNTSRSNYDIALKSYNAIEDMYKGGIASEKEYTTAKGELEKASSELKKAISISNVLGGTNSADYYVKAPASGVIIEKHINPDMQIRTDFNDNLFVLSNLKDVWVMANVFESDISRVKEGCDARITTLSYPDQVTKGRVDKVYSILDPVSKVMKARIRLDNADYQLKPEMFAYITINYSENITRLEIPSKALIFDNSKYYVLVFKDKSNIEIREVSLYKSAGDITYIENGLKAGEKIILNNNLLIYDQLTD